MSILAIVAASCLSTDARATLWPFDPQTTPPQLGSIFGDYDEDRLHNGFDIGEPAGTPVKAMEDGYVIGFYVPDPGKADGIIVIGATTNATEGWSYGHVMFSASSISIGTHFTAGQVIATVDNFSTTFNHLHLERMAPDLTPIPKNPFQFFSGSQLPTQAALMDPANIFFTPDKMGKLSAFPVMANGRTQVSGDVDVLAEAHNQVGSLTSPGVYQVSYYVHNAAGSSVIAERTQAVFNQFTPADETSKFRIVYGPGSTSFHALYVVTNSGDQAPSAADGTSNAIENAWFTKARTGVSDGAGGLAAADMASGNPEAKYPDGSYTVGVRAQTFDGKQAVAERKAVVLNWRLHAAKTRIQDSGGKIRQIIEWIWDGIQKKFNRGTSPGSAFLGPGTYTVQTVFSEPVESVTMAVDTIGSLTPTSSDPAEQQQTFTAPLVIDANTQAGTRTLTITAKNLGGDDLLALGPNDTTIDPATQLARDANGAFLGTAGSDTSVSFTIAKQHLAANTCASNPIDDYGIIRSDCVLFAANDLAGERDVVIDPPDFTQVDLGHGAQSISGVFPAAPNDPKQYSGTPLPDGPYVLFAVDELGQGATVHFTIKNTPSQFSGYAIIPPPPGSPPDVSASLAPIVNGGQTADRNVRIEVADAVFASATVTVTGYEPVQIDTTTEYVELDDLDPGHYHAETTDPVGNVGKFDFEIRTFGPTVSAFDIQNAWGSIPAQPRVLTKSNGFTVNSAADLDSITLSNGTLTLFPVMTGAHYPPGTHNVTGSAAGGNGTYTLTATDVLGGVTTLSWQVGDLSATSDIPSDTYVWIGSESFTADLTWTSNSTFGIYDIATFDVNNPAAVLHVPGPGHLTTPDMTVTVSSPTQTREYFYTDNGSNNAEFFSTLQLARISTAAFVFSAFGDGNGARINQSTTSATLVVEDFIELHYSTANLLAGPRVMIVPDTFTAFAAPLQLDVNVLNVPITPTQTIGHVKMTEHGTGTTLLDQDVDFIVDFDGNPLVTPIDIKSHTVGIGSKVAIDVTITVSTPTSVTLDNCLEVSTTDPHMCDVGQPFSLMAGILPTFVFLTGSVNGADSGTGMAVQNTDVINAGLGVTISGLSSSHTTGASAALIGLEIPGWVDVGGPYAYEVGGDPAAFSKGVTVNLPGPPAITGQDPGTIKLLFHSTVDPTDPNVCTPYAPLEASISPSGTSVRLTAPGVLKYAIDEFSSRVVTPPVGNLSFVSNGPAVQITDVRSDPRYAQALNVLGASGKGLVGLAWEAAPTGRSFTPSAVVQVTLTPDDVATANLDPNSYQMIQFSLAGGAQQVASLEYDPACGQAIGRVPVLTSVFGVFGASATVAAKDLLPPVTTLLVDGNPVSIAGGLTITSTSTLSLSPVDPLFPGAPTSGLDRTNLGLDVPFTSTNATPGAAYAGPFTLTQGAHNLFYYSADKAQNTESPSVVSITVNAPPTRSVGGVGLGIDTQSLLWSVAQDGANVGFAHYSSTGVLIASATLAGAQTGLPWSVQFDGSGAAYAIGTADGANGALIAIYKASSAGDAIVSSQTFDSGFNSNNFVLAASPAGWIAGAVETTAPSAPTPTFAAALWRFNPAQGLVSLTTYYTRAGVDALTGVTTDAAGNIWVAGFSKSPNPRSTRPIDLVVSEFAADGATLLAGPFVREGYLSQFDGTQLAQIALINGAVVVAAPRGRAAAGTDLALVEFSTAGAVLVESGWRFANNASADPTALLADPNSEPVVVGAYDAGDTQAAVWRYSSTGTLSSVSVVPAGGARGAAYQGWNLWMTVDGSSIPFLDADETTPAGAPSDVEPPRTTVVAGAPQVFTDILYAGPGSQFGLSVVDDAYAVGDGLGVGVSQTIFSVDDSSFTVYESSFSLAEGTHTVSFYSLDKEGNAERFQYVDVAVDLTSPTVAFMALSSTTFAIQAQDPVVNGASSGLAQVKFLVDVPPQSCAGVSSSSSAPAGTCPNSNYAGAFTLVPGTHTVYFQAVDNVGNGANVINSSYVVVGGGGNAGMANYVLNPTTGPIGIPFAFTGPGGFGSYQGANTRVLFGGAAAPLSVWNDTTIDGTVPGLSTGTYAVSVVIGTNTYPAGGFTVLYPTATAISVSSGPIGAPFVISGAQFGPYAGGLTRVLIGGATAPLSVWNDNTVAGTIPALSTGVYTVQVQRATGDGGVMSLSPFSMTVVGFNPTGFSPSSGPIGVPFTVTGSGFGPYAGNLTQFLFDGKPAALSVWNDSTISGTVPNLSSGTHAVWISRQSSDGGLVVSGTTYFTVTVPVISTVAPTSGPIGNGFLITGRSFGAYGGSSTQVLFGGATTPLSVWNDTRIAGSVPGSLLPGLYPLYVERLTSDGGLVASNTVYFTVTAPFGASLSVSSGPIGVPFTITGTGFGSYAGANTVVLIGGKPAPLSVWNDTTISGSIPNLSTGAYGVLVERLSGNSVSSAAVGGFTVVGLNPQGLNPLSGPIGAPFTLTGSAFGPYAGGLTRVLFDGTAAALSVWNDAQIAGAVPALSTGPHALWIERASSDGGLMSSGTVYFTVVAPSPTGLTPTAGPIGSPFTITGSGFGPYGGANTRVMIGGLAAPLSVWNDTTISGNVPALSSGPAALWIERQAGSSVQSSGTTYFNVTLPAVASFSPSSAPVGAPFTFLGSGFGPYRGSNTQVLFNGTPAPLSVWNDGQVSGSVPGGLTAGPYGVVLQITAPGGSVQAATQTFTVLTPTIQAMSPTYGLAGTGVQLTGFGFGPYGGAQTQVLLGTTSVPLSVWNDGRIVWTVPSGVPNGTYPVVVSRTPSGGGVQSASMTFTVGATAGVALFAAAAPALAAQPDWHFEGALFLSTDTGGRIQSPSNAAVSVPPTALSSGTVVTMARDKTSYSASRAAAAGADKLGAGGEAVSFGPEGTRFNVPVTIELPYDPALVPVDKLGELAVHYYDPGAKTWTPLVSSVDPVRHVVSAQTTHFSLYQPLGHGIGVTAADASFGLKAAYAFPNPVHSGAVTIRVQPGLADSVSVRVYDLGGRKVHDSSDFTLNAALDDGNGLGAQYTYDHVWDVSGVGSGVYTYVITAKKAGSADIHKTGKIGVSK